MTEEDIKELVEWSTTKVKEQMRNNEPIYLTVRAYHAAEHPESEIIHYLISRCKDDDYLMDNVFEPLTGVMFDDIDWSGIIDTLTDRKVNA